MNLADNLPAEFRALIGPGPAMTGQDLQRAVMMDMGLPETDKVNLLRVLNSPNVVENLIAGGAGAGVGLAVARYREMSPPAQVLMSLAGFGLGNIILNKLTQPGKFTNWNSETGKVHIK